MSEKFEKLEVDGKVAVLYSGGFGAGWSSWCALYSGEKGARMCMDKDIALAVLDDDIPRAIKAAKAIDENFYTGGSDGLTVEWVPKGHRFEIVEYDGRESVRIFGEDDGFVA